jgi:hypothetical protein
VTEAWISVKTGPAHSVDSTWLWLLWGAGLAVAGWAVLGAASTAVARADMRVIHATVLSKYTGDIRRRLAADYAKLVVSNEKQIMTRVINLWRAVTALVIAALLTLGAWMWADAARSEPPRPPCSCQPARPSPLWPHHPPWPQAHIHKVPRHGHRRPCLGHRPWPPYRVLPPGR